MIKVEDQRLRYNKRTIYLGKAETKGQGQNQGQGRGAEADK